TILHVLNRIGFGHRPGDVDRVRAMGLQRYIEQQLYPDRIHDDSVAARIGGLSTLTLSLREISEQYELPQIEMRQQRRNQAGANNPNQSEPKMPDALQQRANNLVLELGQQKVLR